MQCLEVSCVVRPIYGSLGAKGLSKLCHARKLCWPSHVANCVRKCVIFIFVELIPVAVKVRHPRMEDLLRQV
jgi:hypothetical protein